MCRMWFADSSSVASVGFVFLIAVSWRVVELLLLIIYGLTDPDLDPMAGEISSDIMFCE